MHIRHIAAVLIISVLSACESVTHFAPPTETVEPLFIPTLNESPFTPTPELENTLFLAPTTNVNLGTPIPDWEGIPVMPRATNGEIKAFGYMYWVSVTTEEVQTFYTEQ